MRVVHLSTACGPADGGAFRAAYRLHDAIRNQGIESTVLTASSSADDPDVHLISRATIGDRLRQSFGQKMEGLVSRYARPSRGNVWTSGFAGAVRIDQHPDVLRADVIMLYWVGRGFLSTARIGQLLRLGKPVVWRLSDMWAFTGGCHYSMGCDRYRERCGSCPQLRSSRELDLSRLVWLEKRRSWQVGALTLVCPSTWMANCVRQSALLSAASVRVIHTGVDVSLYRPFDRRAAREILRLPQEARIVLTCADDFRADGDRKGSAYVLDAMFRVMERVPNAYLAVFGSARKPEGIPSTAFGAVRDERLLALIYAAADIFVSTALEDNLPNTVLEALSSGLPVVGFGIGGLLDAVRDEHTGYLSPPRDMEALAGQISRCLLDDEGRQMKSRNARESALALFDARASGTEYAALFRDLCGAR